ncbi:hypothetical protein [Halorarius litoreus]|uniref:hypothetical protein n=1 Tax=Halorarius litoreus TaxID=2962676 RepID=UPI0020CC4A07|nr:hypothetical protein [Halorarius litoreus]
MATTTTPIVGRPSPAQWRDLDIVGKVRRAAFYVVAVGALGLAVFMLGGELLLGITGWVENLGIHQIHDLTIFGLLWLALVVPLALLLYRPARRVNTILAPILFLVPVAIFAALANSPILMLPLIFGVLGLVALVLHPAGRDLLRFDRTESPSRILVGLLVVAAVPLLLYAGDQLVRQLTLADEHAMFVHYAGMAIASMYVLVMGVLAVVRERDWRFAAWSAGVVALILGVSSILFTVESSAGVLWGALAVLWAVVFVGAVEYTRRATTEKERTTRTTPVASD